METICLKGRVASRGVAAGYALVVPHALSFLSDIDLAHGTIRVPSSPVNGQSIVGKVLVFPTGRGSTADPYGSYMLKKAGKAPAAIVNNTGNPTTVAGCIVARIPMVYRLEQDPLELVCTGDYIRVDAEVGTISIDKTGA